MKSIAIVLAALSLTACAGFGPFPLSEAQKEAIKLRADCKVNPALADCRYLATVEGE